MKEKVLESLKRTVTTIMLILPGILVVLPIVLLITGSVMDHYELTGYLTSVFMDGEEFISWKLMPRPLLQSEPSQVLSNTANSAPKPPLRSISKV